MSVLEVLVYVVVSSILVLGVTGAVPRFVGVEPYELKAEVFSYLSNLRASGLRYVLRIDGEKITVVTFGNHHGRFETDHGIGVEYVTGGLRSRITYRNGRISRGGTFYGKGWSLSFQPVTGLMKVREGR